MKSGARMIELKIPYAPSGQYTLVHEEPTFRPEVNLLREEYYWLSTAGNSVRIWRNSDCVVLGRFLKQEEEVWMEKAEAAGVQVLKRTSGGGAVFHDRGNINYSFYLDAGSVGRWRIEESFEPLSYPITRLLDKLGIPWKWVPPNNIYVEGRKISGSAQARRKGRLLHHGTLLVDTDQDKMRFVLRDGGRSHTAPTVNLRELVPDITVEDTEASLREIITGGISPVI